VIHRRHFMVLCNSSTVSVIAYRHKR
jgi:hypothetical protein